MPRIDRRSFLQHSAAIGSAALLATSVRARSINERLNIGFIGLGGRSKELLPRFAALSDVRIAALCDVDEERLHQAADSHPGAKKYGDLRKLLDDNSIDAVAIATCNHWHVLAAIWACQAGKDVYVEKPLSHNHWEGVQLVRAARKYDRIVQVGTQQRSDPLQAELKQFIHKDKELGEIKYVQVCRFGPRASIGKRAKPLEIPKSVNYDLWLGPAQNKPIYRNQFHYDWHWVWNTGNGELGNWGVHVLDDALNVALQDRCPFPKRLSAGGGRFVWNDAGETPNVCLACYDTGSVPLLFGLSNLPESAKSKHALRIDHIATGYIVHCEGGSYAGGRGGGAAHAPDGKVIRKFKGDSGAGHQRNFVDAVMAHNRRLLNAEVQIGHQSTAWCNLADVAVRMGGQYAHDKAVAIGHGFEPWGELVDVIERHLSRNKVNLKSANLQLSPTLEFDSEKQQFVGEFADSANRFLRRKYRPQFKVEAIAS
ncbi:MAG TPA: Gfo/Idh/MocA family oxidoreductase [Lacipirellulaceae bacterium]|nr:Gfo/Idh/MocA family oxidoreductase [Lacipirellulaceae bacterium]